jgi:hypothetical protein
LGRIPDHNDKVEENALSAAFESTARHWRSRFGVPYSLCGCGPTSTTIVEKLSSVFRPRSKDSFTPLEQLNTRKDICSTEERDAAATHPSEHNAVQLITDTGLVKLRNEREQKALAHEKKIQNEIAKGKYKDEWERMLIERDAQRGHARAFLLPMAYWGM